MLDIQAAFATQAQDPLKTLDRRLYAGPERRASLARMTRWLTLMLDEMDHGMLLVAPNGQLRHANQLAQQELARGASLHLHNKMVQAHRPDQQVGLAQALAEAGRGRRRLVTLGEEGQALSVAVVPLASEDEEQESLALLVLGKHRHCSTLTVDFFARTQGLTGAEANVLQALCSGLRPKEIAREFGVAISTVRSQISSIRTKTQTASIRDLINRVAVLPPITSAMKTALTH